MIRRLAVLSFALLITVHPASAQKGADLLWQRWQADAAARGLDLHAESQAAGADGLDLSGLHLGQSDAGGSIAVRLDHAHLSDDGAGGARLTIPAGQILNLDLNLDQAEPISATFRITGDDTSLAAPGPDAPYRLSAPALTLTLQSLSPDIAPAELTATLDVTGLTGMLAGADAAPDAPVTADLSASAVSAVIATKNPGDEHARATSIRQGDVTVSLHHDPGTASDGWTTTLDARSGAGTFSSGPDIPGTGIVPDLDASQLSGAYLVTLTPTRRETTQHFEGVRYSAALPFSPVNPVTLSADSAVFVLSEPGGSASGPQDFAFTADLKGLMPGAEIWNLFDPNGVLKRSPGALAADLAGTVMRDGAAPFLAVEPAGEIRHLSLNNLSADLAGVHLDATGQGDVTPAPDGGGPGDDMAALGIPSGRLDLHVTGFLGLLDTLSNGGSLAPERAAGLKTLLAVFARRGEDGSLTSDITLSPEDGLAINGTALR